MYFIENEIIVTKKQECIVNLSYLYSVYSLVLNNSSCLIKSNRMFWMKDLTHKVTSC